MKPISIIVADDSEFFAQGKLVAALAEAGKPISGASVISFGAQADLLKILTSLLLASISAVKAQPDAITAIAERLHHDRSAVKRDVHSLPKAGLLVVRRTVLAGQDKMKPVTLVAQKMRLQAGLVYFVIKFRIWMALCQG